MITIFRGEGGGGGYTKEVIAFCFGIFCRERRVHEVCFTRKIMCSFTKCPV